MEGKPHLAHQLVTKHIGISPNKEALPKRWGSAEGTGEVTLAWTEKGPDYKGTTRWGRGHKDWKTHQSGFDADTFRCLERQGKVPSLKEKLDD